MNIRQKNTFTTEFFYLPNTTHFVDLMIDRYIEIKSFIIAERFLNSRLNFLS